MNGGLYMNTEEKRKKLHQLIDKINDEETLLFIIKIVMRLLD